MQLLLFACNILLASAGGAEQRREGLRLDILDAGGGEGQGDGGDAHGQAAGRVQPQGGRPLAAGCTACRYARVNNPGFVETRKIFFRKRVTQPLHQSDAYGFLLLYFIIVHRSNSTLHLMDQLMLIQRSII